MLTILAGSQWRILLLQSGGWGSIRGRGRDRGRLDTGGRGGLKALVNQHLGRGQLVLALLKSLVLLDLCFKDPAFVANRTLVARALGSRTDVRLCPHSLTNLHLHGLELHHC